MDPRRGSCPPPTQIPGAVVFGRSRLAGLGSSSSKVDREGLQLHREHKGFGSIPGLEGNIEYPVPIVNVIRTVAHIYTGSKSLRSASANIGSTTGQERIEAVERRDRGQQNPA